MARWRIGQVDLVAQPSPRTGAKLSQIVAPLDWVEIEHALAGISAVARGEQGWPPVALFRTLLLGCTVGLGVEN